MLRSPWLPDLFARAFAKVPDVEIWRWAEGADGAPAPFILRKSPEPTYRSGRTPWVRRGGDLIRKPWFNGRRIRRFGAKKSSQSGYTEGVILNPIRWTAKHRPRNCIISVDTLKEVGNISARLLPTLRDLGQRIFTGKEDDLSKFKLSLVGMDVWFDGSFSAGGYSNKYAPWVFNDEVALYGEVSEEGSTVENYWSRAKQADDGYQTVISKPGEEDDPIDAFFLLGNQEFYNVPCPHHGCRERQPLEWSRVEYEHCKVDGVWDQEKMLDDTFYRCRKCGQPIRDRDKFEMNPDGVWIPTAKGDPEIVTQHMSDLYSVAAGSTLGHLAKEFVRAEEADSRSLRMTFQQQRLGLAWKQKMHKVEESDLLKLRAPYRRGTIPHGKCALALGMDIGLYTNTRWIVYAFNQAGEMWLVDWGGHPALNVAPATGPAEVINVMRAKRYLCAETGAKQAIQFAFLDARYRTDEVYETCLLAPRQLFPAMGLRGRAARSINYRQIPNRPEGFAQINFINEDAMYDLYVDRIKLLKPPGLHWCENVEDIVLREHSAERLIRDKRTNKVVWEDDHKRPNHYGDSTKIVLTGIDWLIGGKRSRIITDIQEFDHERAASINFDAGIVAA